MKYFDKWTVEEALMEPYWYLSMAGNKEAHNQFTINPSSTLHKIGVRLIGLISFSISAAGHALGKGET